MVMTVRFRSFRNLLAPQTARARAGTAAVVLAIAVGLVLVPGLTALLVAYGYVLTAPLGVLSAPLRERLLGAASVAPPRRRMPSVFLPIDEDAEEDDGLDDDLDDLDDEAYRPPEDGKDSPPATPSATV